MKKPNIQTALAAVCRPLTDKAELTAERLLEELRRIAFTSVTDVMEWDNDGVPVKPSDELTAESAAAIRSIEITETREAGDEGEVLDRKVQVRTHSKERALRQLGKYLGLRKDPYEVQAEILEVFEGMSPKELKKFEEMGDDDLMELVGKHGIYRLLSVVNGL